LERAQALDTPEGVFKSSLPIGLSFLDPDNGEAGTESCTNIQHQRPRSLLLLLLAGYLRPSLPHRRNSSLDFSVCPLEGRILAYISTIIAMFSPHQAEIEALNPDVLGPSWLFVCNVQLGLEHSRSNAVLTAHGAKSQSVQKGILPRKVSYRIDYRPHHKPPCDTLA
jgi:hypothetical protein